MSAKTAQLCHCSWKADVHQWTWLCSNTTFFTKREGREEWSLGCSLPIPGLRNYTWGITFFCGKTKSVSFLKFSVIHFQKPFLILNIHMNQKSEKRLHSDNSMSKTRMIKNLYSSPEFRYTAKSIFLCIYVFTYFLRRSLALWPGWSTVAKSWLTATSRLPGSSNSPV